MDDVSDQVYYILFNVEFDCYCSINTRSEKDFITHICFTIAQRRFNHD